MELKVGREAETLLRFLIRSLATTEAIPVIVGVSTLKTSVTARVITTARVLMTVRR